MMSKLSIDCSTREGRHAAAQRQQQQQQRDVDVGLSYGLFTSNPKAFDGAPLGSLKKAPIMISASTEKLNGRSCFENDMMQGYRQGMHQLQHCARHKHYN